MRVLPKSKHRYIILIGVFLFLLFCSREIGNFYQTGHAGFVNAEVGLSHMNTINNGPIRTKLGATNYQVIFDRAPELEEYYVRYPHLHNLLMAALWSVTGVSEIAARLFVIFLTLGSLFIFYRIALELDFGPKASSFVFFTLCCFPVFFHYAGLSNGEISMLFPLALTYLFFIKNIKSPEFRSRFFLFLSLSIACQLFWYAYLAAFVLFIDCLLQYSRTKDRSYLKLCLGFVVTVTVNISIFILHTFWMVGSLDKVLEAFLWRTSLRLPETQVFTWFDFFVRFLQRYWLFNPVIILLALFTLVRILRKKKSLETTPLLKNRMLFILLCTPLLFSLALSHLVHYHDFLVIYFAFFLALAGIDAFFRLLERRPEGSNKKLLTTGLVTALILFAVFGVLKEPEEKYLDIEKDNFELYFALNVIHNLSTKDDMFLLTLNRIQEPQVSFYLRRVSEFNHVPKWAKGYAESGKFSFYLVDNVMEYRPLIKYLFKHYRCYKYYRYFLFDLRRPGEGFRVFRREQREPNLLRKYFISPNYGPGDYREISDQRTKDNIMRMFEEAPDLKFEEDEETGKQ
ncbi:ArnT family glycosyltransferase [Acidobacteriota bacterium]